MVVLSKKKNVSNFRNNSRNKINLKSRSKSQSSLSFKSNFSSKSKKNVSRSNFKNKFKAKSNFRSGQKANKTMRKTMMKTMRGGAAIEHAPTQVEKQEHGPEHLPRNTHVPLKRTYSLSKFKETPVTSITTLPMHEIGSITQKDSPYGNIFNIRESGIPLARPQSLLERTNKFGKSIRKNPIEYGAKVKPIIKTELDERLGSKPVYNTAAPGPTYSTATVTPTYSTAASAASAGLPKININTSPQNILQRSPFYAVARSNPTNNLLSVIGLSNTSKTSSNMKAIMAAQKRNKLKSIPEFGEEVLLMEGGPPNAFENLQRRAEEEENIYSGDFEVNPNAHTLVKKLTHALQTHPLNQKKTGTVTRASTLFKDKNKEQKELLEVAEAQIAASLAAKEEEAKKQKKVAAEQAAQKAAQAAQKAAQKLRNEEEAQKLRNEEAAAQKLRNEEEAAQKLRNEEEAAPEYHLALSYPKENIYAEPKVVINNFEKEQKVKKEKEEQKKQKEIVARPDYHLATSSPINEDIYGNLQEVEEEEVLPFPTRIFEQGEEKEKENTYYAENTTKSTTQPLYAQTESSMLPAYGESYNPFDEAIYDAPLDNKVPQSVPFKGGITNPIYNIKATTDTNATTATTATTANTSPIAPPRNQSKNSSSSPSPSPSNTYEMPIISGLHPSKSKIKHMVGKKYEIYNAPIDATGNFEFNNSDERVTYEEVKRYNSRPLQLPTLPPQLAPNRVKEHAFSPTEQIYEASKIEHAIIPEDISVVENVMRNSVIESNGNKYSSKTPFHKMNPADILRALREQVVNKEPTINLQEIDISKLNILPRRPNLLHTTIETTLLKKATLSKILNELVTQYSVTDNNNKRAELFAEMNNCIEQIRYLEEFYKAIIERKNPNYNTAKNYGINNLNLQQDRNKTRMQIKKMNEYFMTHRNEFEYANVKQELLNPNQLKKILYHLVAKFIQKNNPTDIALNEDQQKILSSTTTIQDLLRESRNIELIVLKLQEKINNSADVYISDIESTYKQSIPSDKRVDALYEINVYIAQIMNLKKFEKDITKLINNILENNLRQLNADINEKAKNEYRKSETYRKHYKEFFDINKDIKNSKTNDFNKYSTIMENEEKIVSENIKKLLREYNKLTKSLFTVDNGQVKNNMDPEIENKIKHIAKHLAEQRHILDIAQQIQLAIIYKKNQTPGTKLTIENTKEHIERMKNIINNNKTLRIIPGAKVKFGNYIPEIDQYRFTLSYKGVQIRPTDKEYINYLSPTVFKEIEKKLNQIPSHIKERESSRAREIESHRGEKIPELTKPITKPIIGFYNNLPLLQKTSPITKTLTVKTAGNAGNSGTKTVKFGSVYKSANVQAPSPVTLKRKELPKASELKASKPETLKRRFATRISLSSPVQMFFTPPEKSTSMGPTSSSDPIVNLTESRDLDLDNTNETATELAGFYSNVTQEGVLKKNPLFDESEVNEENAKK